MAKFTRRGLLGGTAAILGAGLTACGQKDKEPTASQEVRVDTREPYAGKVEFQHGVASGDPLANWVIIWTRVTPVTGDGGSIPVTYGVFEDAEMTIPVAYGLTTAEASRDYCIKIDIDGLEPGTDYFYRFEARDETGKVGSPLGRARTLPAANSTSPVRLAVVSCSNWPFGYFNAYRSIAQRTDLDAVVHLGDYIYEYGVDGYGGEVGAALGRDHEPITEIVTLADYRARHAQYKSDPDLQAAHAAAPWICTWDDHESANDAYRNGAQNHNPENNEGNWSTRKQVAVQAYLEWMPVRDPEPGRLREAIYRRFDFGKVASLICLESRLTGRSDEISWFTEIGDLPANEVPMAAVRTMTKVGDPSRTMLGQLQEDWLDEQLADSRRSGHAWQVLGNQVIMARVKPPALQRTLTQEQIDMQTGYGRQLVDFSVLGLPWNLDAWDGFPAARERLYDSAQNAKARLVTLTGDTHTAWANELFDSDGERRGVEFGTTSITSPGFGIYMTGVPDLGDQFAAANEEVVWYDPNGNGYCVVTLTTDRARAEYFKVSTVRDREFQTNRVKVYETVVDGDSMTGLVEA